MPFDRKFQKIISSCGNYEKIPRHHVTTSFYYEKIPRLLRKDTASPRHYVPLLRKDTTSFHFVNFVNLGRSFDFSFSICAILCIFIDFRYQTSTFDFYSLLIAQRQLGNEGTAIWKRGTAIWKRGTAIWQRRHLFTQTKLTWKELPAL